MENQEVGSCPATTLMKDDRYGGFITKCSQIEDHEGPHTHPMTACEPVAWLSWLGSYT